MPFESVQRIKEGSFYGNQTDTFRFESFSHTAASLIRKKKGRERIRLRSPVDLAFIRTPLTIRGGSLSRIDSASGLNSGRRSGVALSQVYHFLPLRVTIVRRESSTKHSFLCTLPLSPPILSAFLRTFLLSIASKAMESTDNI